MNKKLRKRVLSVLKEVEYSGWYYGVNVMTDDEKKECKSKECYVS